MEGCWSLWGAMRGNKGDRGYRGHRCARHREEAETWKLEGGGVRLGWGCGELGWGELGWCDWGLGGDGG